MVKSFYIMKPSKPRRVFYEKDLQDRRALRQLRRAAKMEAAVAKLEGVESAVVNYMTQKMTLEFSQGADDQAVLKNVEKICKKVDVDFQLYR